MAEKEDIWVFAEKSGLLFELIAGARSLASESGGRVVAVVLGPRSLAEQAMARGAYRAVWLGELKPGELVDDYVPTLGKLLEDNQPAGFLVEATKRGRAIAGRLAARIGVTVLTDVKEFTQESGRLQARHLIFGGGAIRVDRPLTETWIATAGQGIFESQPPDASRTGDIAQAEFVEPEWRLKLCDRKARQAAAVNLNAARRVVCAGRGIGKKEDLGMVNDLARALEAEVACTRPLAEGLDWLPRERYLGVSGAMIKPDLYLGVGVSGQAQHAVGMSDSRVVAAINKDKEAPIFGFADYGIVGDLYTIVPALIQALQARK